MENSVKDFSQFRKPCGKAGRATVDEMNESHYELTGWGLSKIDVVKDGKILDIGCGGGVTVSRLSKLAPEGTVYGADYSQDCVDWASEYNSKEIDAGKVKIFHADVGDLPFENGAFDLVVAVETMYFWPDIAKGFKEISRVLKSGGTFALINESYECPAFHAKNDELRKYGGMKIFSPTEISRLFSLAGLTASDLHLYEKKNWMCMKAIK